MLACGGQAGLETRSHRDPILETYNAPPSSVWWSRQVPKIHTAVLNKTSDTVTPWLIVGQTEPHGDAGGSGTLRVQPLDSLNQLMRKFVRNWLRPVWGRELSGRLWCWIHVNSGHQVKPTKTEKEKQELEVLSKTFCTLHHLSGFSLIWGLIH